MNGDWLSDDRSDAAVERILDAAGRMFVERGVSSTGMAVVAREAGCSRATIYRYFDGRRSLHLAYVNREARRIGLRVLAETASIEDPRERVVETLMMSLLSVRSDPTVAAWIQLPEVGIAAEMAHASEVVSALGSALLDGVGGDTTRRVRWLVRVLVSFLTVPGVDADDERAMLQEFVVPVLQGADAR